MRRFRAMWTTALILTGVTGAPAQESVPPLQPPQLPGGTPESSPPPDVPTALTPRPLVGRPRLLTPRPPSVRPTLPRLEPAGIPLPALGGPRLDTSLPGPREEILIPSAEAPVLSPRLRPGVPLAPPLEGPQAIPLETIPDDPLDPALQPLAPLPDSASRSRASRDAKELVDLRPPMRRRGLFGLLAPRPRPAVSTRPAGSARSRDPITPDSDPASEAALKRRIEFQVREVGGRHLRSLEVRVNDGRVTVRASADHFWNRRSLRRDIEAIPSLAGHRPTVIVD